MYGKSPLLWGRKGSLPSFHPLPISIVLFMFSLLLAINSRALSSAVDNGPAKGKEKLYCCFRLLAFSAKLGKAAYHCIIQKLTHPPPAPFSPGCPTPPGCPLKKLGSNFK
jgi:hypothetical protein